MNQLKPDLSPEVKAALEAGRPVVALESTIISHGMPYPQNVETARRVEQYRIGKRAIFFPAGLKKQYLPIDAIERAERSERIIRAGKCVPVEERRPALLLHTAHTVVPMALEREESVDAVLAAIDNFQREH